MGGRKEADKLSPAIAMHPNADDMQTGRLHECRGPSRRNSWGEGGGREEENGVE